MTKGTVFNYYENSASVLFSYIITNDYLDSKFTEARIGDNELKSFVYQMVYYGKVLTSGEISASFGVCSGCQCPIDLNACLWECGLNEFLRNSCEMCLPDCNSCKFNDTCSQCKNSLCESCASPNNVSCLTCIENAHLSSNDCYCNSHFFKRNSFCLECNPYCKECNGEDYMNCTSCFASLNGFCLDNCPSLYSLSVDKCIPNTKNLIVFIFDKECDACYNYNN